MLKVDVPFISTYFYVKVTKPEMLALLDEAIEKDPSLSDCVVRWFLKIGE